MMAHVGYLYQIKWHSPYTDPPEGQPRIKAEMFESIEQRKARTAIGEDPFPKSLSRLSNIGDGYGCYISGVSTPTKTISKDALISVRKKRLERRIKNKYPLLADEMIKDELSKKPDYYQGETNALLKESYDEAIQKEIETYQRFLEATREERNDETIV